ncbi:hypothetical protein Nans01_40540 [Nocardiopsis ansamitocini]|uniref:Uncharacterized protein n=1 Tax=Nocardiopsis ansamitocini TaxID=1670832 RepID=A0A9W6PA03_9ACTN|nr:hypothetical protein Nans01_40540 [Nocardiopsis ansamitocini]
MSAQKKFGYIDALAVLPKGVDLAGVLLTAHALHTRTDTAAHLVDRPAHRLCADRQTQPEEAVRPGRATALGFRPPRWAPPVTADADALSPPPSRPSTVQADAARIGALARGRWAIEAWRLAKDASLGGDACEVRCGHTSTTWPCLRAFSLGTLGRLGRETVPDTIPWVSYEACTAGWT